MLVGLTALVPVANAAAVTWDTSAGTSGAQDGTGNWTVGGTTFWNGSANVATTNDVTSDIATFGSGGAGGTVTVSTQSINGLVFDTTTSSGYTLTGGTLTVGAGGITANSGALASNMNSALVMGASLSVINSSSNLLTLGSTVTSAATGTQTLTIGGAGNTTITGLLNDGTSGTLNLTKTGAGYLKLNGAATSIAGAVDIQGGTVGVVNDFTATGLTGTGTLENASNNDKWTFWNISSNQTFDGVFRNNNGVNTGLLGIVKQGTGTLTLTNNSSNQSSNLSVDAGRLVLNNTGTFGAGNQGGATRTNLTASIGNTAAANGVLEINGATVNYNNRSTTGTEDFRTTLSVGNNATGAAALILNSGTLSLNRQLGVGVVAGSFGAYNQTGGNSTVGGFLAIGLNTSKGVFNLSGGNFTLSSAPVTNGAGTGGVGVMNLSGTAIFNHNSPTADEGIWIGESGTGTINVSGSAALNIASTTNGLQLGRLATGAGTANLLGGTVTTKGVYKGLGTGTLNFNGGTLTANSANTTFLTGLTGAYVYSGGGTVNNGGNAITIGQALQAPTGSGVSASGLTVSGAGYIATPVVTISGGGGSGATAVATIDSAGNLTGITITNPGIGYTSAPTFALAGGGIGNTGALGGTATLATNVSGGMTFSGTGTTTLSGVNTYTGPTTISAGTLALGTLGSITSSSGVAIAAGAIFNTAAQTTFTMGVSQTITFGLDGSGAGSAGLLQAAGLSIGSGSVSFSLTGGALDDAAYVLANYTSISGTSFGAVSNLPGGYALDYNYLGGNQIALVAVPEPSAFAALAGLAGLAAVGTRRRRR